MSEKAELSVNLVVIIVIALLILVIVVFIFGGRSSDFGRTTECVAAGGQCVTSGNCDPRLHSDPIISQQMCGLNEVCCRATAVRR